MSLIFFFSIVTHLRTVRQVENETGISNENLSRWERNLVSPSIENCVKLADYYGVTLDDLIGRKL